MIKSLIVIFVAIFYIGCSKQTIDINTSPKIQVPKKVKKVKRKNGSLYSRQGTSLFADKKDLQIGDILQVIVEESLKNDSKGSRDTKKDTTVGLGGGVFAPATGVTLQGGATNALTKANSNIGIGFSSTSANAFKAASTSKVDEKFTTTISVIIEQTYQNGNYFVKGSKEMLIDGQKQKIAISGIIRPYDISPDNTVYSYQLANLKILYKKDGEEVDSLHKNWGTKVIETIWPF